MEESKTIYDKARDMGFAVRELIRSAGDAKNCGFDQLSDDLISKARELVADLKIESKVKQTKGRYPWGERPFVDFTRMSTRKQYVVPTRRRGEEILSQLMDEIETNGDVDIAFLNDLLGLEDHGSRVHSHGWRSLQTASVIRESEYYCLSLPAPIQL